MLRVAKVEVVFEGTSEISRIRYNSEKHKVSLSQRRVLHLKLHIIILALSKKKPTRYQPTIAGSITLDIGCSVRPLFHQLPFALTWEASHLYFTVSSSQLRVYRIDLAEIVARGVVSDSVCPAKRSRDGMTKSGDGNGRSQVAPVLTPKETIFLPRSARTRKVQFLPKAQVAGSRSVVIVGPLYGKRPRPGFCFYLTDEDLGDWIDPSEKEHDESRVLLGQQRFGNLYEQFDVEEDCDIIPCDY